MSMLAHHSPRLVNDEWLTPPAIVSALGMFDLDPCAPRLRPWSTARMHYCIDDNGLCMPWQGRVWLNPPFGREAIKWLARLADHGDGIAFIPARTDTRMFYDCVWGRADAVLFLRGRPHFHYVDGTRARFNVGAAMVLIAYGGRNSAALMQSGLGAFVRECGKPAACPAEAALL